MNSLHVSHRPCGPAGEESYGGGDAGESGKFSEARQSVRDATHQIKTAASDTAARAKETAERAILEKRDEAAGKIGRYSSALHDSARSFEGEDPNIAWFTHQAADRLQRVADYVRTCNYSRFSNDVENVARRNPGLFFGGMFAAGLLAGNLVKASRRRMDDEDTESFETEPRTDWNPSATDPLQNTGSSTEMPTSTPATGF
jgi:hypothetical protein